MLVGTVAAISPVDGVTVRLTVAVNPFSPFIVTVELPVVRASSVMVVGLAVSAKSTTWTLTVMVCVRVPLELVMVAL